MPRALPRKTGETAAGAKVHCEARAGLAERLGRARRGRAAAEGDPERLERARRSAFEASPLVRDHADELLAVTGELARVLPSKVQYERRVDSSGGWCNTDAAHALLENPACVFVWEVKHNPAGMLAGCPNREYNWALQTTDTACDLWEGRPAINEAELAKALIVQTVLGDDALRDAVLERAGKLARTAAGTLGPYFADWKR